MKVDFSQELIDIDGTPIEAPEHLAKKQKIVTLRLAAIEALLHFDPTKDNTGTNKYRCWKLAKMIHRNGPVEVPIEDAAFLKEKIGAFWSPNVVGAAFDAFEGVGVVEPEPPKVLPFREEDGN